MSKKEKKVVANKKSGAGKFVLGALIGASLGVLFAPKAGSETRRELKKKMQDLVDKAKEVDMKEVKENITLKVEEIKEELKDLDREKVLKLAKKKANDIKEKCEELVELAKKKGTPILENAASEVRGKTIEAVKEILEKLEASEQKARK